MAALPVDADSADIVAVGRAAGQSGVRERRAGETELVKQPAPAARGAIQVVAGRSRRRRPGQSILGACSRAFQNRSGQKCAARSGGSFIGKSAGAGGSDGGHFVVVRCAAGEAAVRIGAVGNARRDGRSSLAARTCSPVDVVAGCAADGVPGERVVG